MRAMICKEYGPPESLQLGELPSRALEPNEIRIRVHACGVNFPDTLIIQGKYQVKPPMPFAPGGEVAGEVIEAGSEVKNLKVGDRVMGMTGYGGFAEEVVATANRAIPIPQGMDYVTAAGFSMVYGTSYHGLVQRGRLKAGENLLVLGASGGVGLAAVEIGKALGARVIAAASSPEKLQVAKDHGADELIDYSKEDLKERVKELTSGLGADVIYDPVGGDAFDACLRAINWEGRLLVIGFASGRIPQAPANLPLLKGSEIVGVFWGAFVNRDPKTNYQNFQHLFQLYGEGKIKPHVCRTYPLEKAADALNDLLERRVTGKVVLTPQAG
jgi:NADPH2:quinone reductase